ncbi:hypothetical protein [Polynucleobacter sp. MWH-HuK1]|uniref:hypothetical protein n=1 Tax=Polynucleobacter sp. MWH-HuK1 TaxID=1743158 RepID=UPI001C0DA173|nr:hypothetical protein [Polynucleobacter sp. MWH-HuK1]
MPQFDRNMGCTSADLMRWLPQALGELHTNTSLVVDGRVLKDAAQPQLRIFGSSQPVRKIALLEIPVLQVRLQFPDDWSQGDCEAVLNRFDLYTRRGGG